MEDFQMDFLEKLDITAKMAFGKSVLRDLLVFSY